MHTSEARFVAFLPRQADRVVVRHRVEAFVRPIPANHFSDNLIALAVVDPEPFVALGRNERDCLIREALSKVMRV